MRVLAGGRVRVRTSPKPTSEALEVALFRLREAERVANKYWPPEMLGEGPYFQGALDAQEYVTASLRLALGLDTSLPAEPKEES